MLLKELDKALERSRVTNGKKFRLKDHDPADTAGYRLTHEEEAALLAAGIARLSDLQELLYAQRSWSLLCVFQAMDAAGKDGTIKHVMSGVNPQGVEVTSFKQPGPEELAHDFLWRVMRNLPDRGRIGIFNRSHYEEVLVVRVHRDLLARQHLPERLDGKNIWKHRLEDIASFERYLTRQGTVILKFFLNVSKEEQKRRFLERMNHPSKNWKFSPADLAEREYWDDYIAAYEEAIAATATSHAPWSVIPADNKGFAHLLVGAAIIEALENLDLKPPKLPPEELARLAKGRRALEAEK